jgi:hypothetical protein
MPALVDPRVVINIVVPRRTDWFAQKRCDIELERHERASPSG